MSYTALYRKFRPLTFKEMVGQEHITNTLKKQIIAERVGHAYLFNGGRGTGKTTTAKIMARAVNCLNIHDGEPCNECEICKGIISGALTDVVEMDAASNNSVEDIRSIREEVNFLPTRAKYRVYIIDEVHMLSSGAYNALLKTLEEPPQHVKFILATTEPQKIPATILSRCQRFDFKRISDDDIIKRLEIICNESNIKITPEALKIIAILSEGAMRDAISILERCIIEDIDQIDENYIRDLVGIPKTTQIYEITKGILEYDIENTMFVINTIINEGKDIDNFLWEIIKYIKNLLIYKATQKIDIYSEQEKANMSTLIQKVEKERLLKIIFDLSKLANDIKWSSQKTIMFQAGILNVCVDTMENNNMVSQKNIQTNPNIEKQNIKQNDNLRENENSINQKQKTIAVKDKVDTKEETINSYWNNVMNTLKQNGKMSMYANLIGSTARKINDLVIEITLGSKNAIAKELLETYENRSEIEKIISQEFGKPMNIKVVIAEENNKKEDNLSTIEGIANDMNIPFNVIDK